MKKNIIANLLNILFSLIFMGIVFLIDLNPLSLIISVVISVTNMLLAIYTIGIKDYPVIKIGRFEGSEIFCNLVIFIIQVMLITSALSNSLWLSIIALAAILVLVQYIMFAIKELYKFLRFHLIIIFTISYTTMILYCVFLAYRDLGLKIPTTIVSVILTGIYIFLIYKEKKIMRVTELSAIFSMALMLLSIGDFTSQGIYSAIHYIISFTPVMFLLLLACYNITKTYSENKVSTVTAALVNLPISGIGYFIGLLAIVGLPPFSLFFGRLMIIQSSITSGDYFRAALIAVIVVLSSYFIPTRIMPALFGSKHKELIGVKEDKYTIAIIFFLMILALLFTILIPGAIGELISNARAYVMGEL